MTVAPFFVWNAGWAFVRGDRGWLAMILVFAILTGCAAATLVQQSGRRLEACLTVFLAGQALAMCLFWILKLNLGEPVEAFNTEIYSSSLVEGARIGTARGNANVLGPPMALVLAGVIAFFFTRPLQFTRRGWILGLAGLIGIAAVLPPLIGSGSRGALVSVACGLLFLLFAGGISPKMLSSLPVVLIGVLLIFGLGWNKLGLNQSWEEMGRRQEMQEEQLGSGAGNKLVAGRSLEWTAAVRGILDSPIIGGGHVEKLSYFGQEEFWLSHSTYLDAGLVGGLPGMALFGWFVLKPLLELWRRRREGKIGWLLAVYAVSIISIGSTSAMQMKDFWILWGIAAACFLPAVARVKTRRNRVARRRSNVRTKQATSNQPALAADSDVSA
jgi:O-antigen ligase